MLVVGSRMQFNFFEGRSYFLLRGMSIFHFFHRLGAGGSVAASAGCAFRNVFDLYSARA